MPESKPAVSDLTHFDEEGGAHMVDVGAKPDTRRIAVATGHIDMAPETLAVVREGRAEKGDVLGVARIAAIMAAKKTHDIIPMCHPLMLTKISVDFELDETGVAITAEVHTSGKTGVEMEALTAVSAAGLTIYDMLKAIDRGMTINAIQLASKEGGHSGEWKRSESTQE